SLGRIVASVFFVDAFVVNTFIVGVCDFGAIHPDNIHIGNRGFRDALHTDQTLAFFQANYAHALRVTAQHRNFAAAGAYQRALIGDQHHFIAVEDLHGAGQTAVAFADLHGNHAHRAAALGREIIDIGAFAVTVFADGQHLAILLRNDQ